MHQNGEFVRSLIGNRSMQVLPEPLRLFGQFVGSWTWNGSDYLENGKKIPTKGRWIFERVLNGNAIQDVFIFENPSKTPEDTPFAEYGTTLRFPLDEGTVWKCVWIGPMNTVIRILEAKTVGDEIVLETKNEQGEIIRWIFSDVTQVSFRWRGERSADGGKSWILYEELRAKRG